MKKSLITLLLLLGISFSNSKSIIQKDFNFLSSDESDSNKHAKIAREIVHKSEWAAFGTISTLKQMKGFPMVNIISTADSPKGEKSTGNIYFYLTPLDYTAQDILKDNKLTVMFSNDEDLACDKMNIDPMEPTCPKVVFGGTVYQLDKDTDEYQFANKSFFSHHPAAANWLHHTTNHSFFLCKLNISFVSVLDGYGGPHLLTPEDYFNVILDDEMTDGASKPKFSLNKVNYYRPINDKTIKIKIDKNSNFINIEV